REWGAAVVTKVFEKPSVMGPVVAADREATDHRLPQLHEERAHPIGSLTPTQGRRKDRLVLPVVPVVLRRPVIRRVRACRCARPPGSRYRDRATRESDC